MFGFLKDKVKSAISSITDRFDKEAEIVETKEEEKLSESIQEEAQEILEEKKIVREEKKTAEEKKGFFAKVSEAVTTKKISASQFEELFWDLEVELLENNVAFEVIEKIKQDLKSKLVDVPLKRGEVEKTIVDSLKESIDEVLDFESFDLLEKVKKKKEKPYVIVFIGVNGSGKTTTISKVAHLLKKNNVSSVLVAADTFRAINNSFL